tara:strand:+ start:1 stop:870 length:870 start_codon:yes stop_codon:yes gene_type:complete
MSLDNRDKPLLILGPTSSAVLDSLLSNSKLPEDMPHSDLIIQWQSWHQLGGTTEKLGYPVRWILGDVKADRWVEIIPDEQKVVELSSMPQPSGWTKNRVTALETKHTVPSCGWHFSAKGKKGKFNRLKAAELKLSESQKAGLAKGEDQVLESGELLAAGEFRGPDSGAISAVLSGDTAEMSQGISNLESCDVLIHEATFLDAWSEHASNYLHSTASGAARTAKSCGAKHLVLTHFGARIKNADEMIAEAQSQIEDFDISLTAARDGDRIVLLDNGQISHLVWNEQGWNN